MNEATRTQEASRKAETFSLPLMRAAFEDVQDAQDWKAPIDSVCFTVNRELTRQAVIHYTGTVPTFKAATAHCSGADGEIFSKPCEYVLRVTATGYRNGPCADQ